MHLNCKNDLSHKKPVLPLNMELEKKKKVNNKKINADVLNKYSLSPSFTGEFCQLYK